MKALKQHFKHLTALFLALAAAATLLPPGALAQGGGQVVRVGWFDSPFNKVDEMGRRSGYAYDYQQMLAAYTGWTYEYVEGSWPDLLEMLIDGRIDLLSDVSYTPERAEHMLFPSLSMGAEDYYIYIKPDNREITVDNLGSFNGKRAGVNKGSVQADMLRDWAAANGVEMEIVEMTETLDTTLEKLYHGDIDMYTALDAYWHADVATPIVKIGASDYYFAISRDRPELLSELNAAQNRIQSENPYYNQQLNQKYLKTSSANLYLDADERDWLAGHGTIRVGYQDNYLAFCASDPSTGELTGALAEYLRVAADCMKNAHLDFKAYSYPTAEAAIKAMKAGEVDCVFPCNLTAYDGESQGLLVSPPLMTTDMSAVIRTSDQQTFAKKDRVTVAVNIGNTNYNMFLLDHYPDWRPIYYQDTPSGLRAISNGQADCLLISNYRYNNISALCRKLDLVTLSTGVAMDYCFAINRDATQLYSILSKVSDAVPTSTINAALSYYFTEDARLGIDELLRQNLGFIVAAIAVVAAVILYLLLRSARSEKKMHQKEMLISATETDAMTGLYFRNFFYAYARQMQQKNPDKPMDAILLNIEQFHTVNAVNGRAFGDQVIRALGEEIHAFLAETEGIGGYAEADHFGIYCAHMEDYQPLLNRLQHRMDLMSAKANIILRMGVMPWQKDMDAHQQIEQALIACNTARGRSNEHLIVVDDALRERENYEQRLVNDLRRALEQREFVVHYQPQYDIQADPPKLLSLEALVRWQHPELGLIPPVDFIPLFERNGQISELDKFVWTEAARQIADWKQRYAVTIPVSVNLSRVDVFDPTLGKTLDALLEEHGLSYGDLKLEMTESACTENPNQVITVIERLRKKGYEIEMDDFGTGYSSLSMLSSLPINVLKLDQAFVRNIEHSRKDMQLVELILGIAENLKIPVIAEGVETEAQLRLLRDMGCDMVQGFYLSRPLAAADFEAGFLRNLIGELR